MTYLARVGQTVSLLTGTVSLGSLLFLALNYGELPGLKFSLTDALSVVSVRSIGMVASATLTALAVSWLLLSRVRELPHSLGKLLAVSACVASLATVAQQSEIVAGCLYTGMPGYLTAYHAFNAALSGLILTASLLCWTAYARHK